MRVLPLLAGLMVLGAVEARAQESDLDVPDVIQRWVGIWDGSMDLDEYLALFTDDVAFRDAETGRILHGKAELTEFVRPFAQLTDMSAAILGYAVNGDTVFIEGQLNGTAPSGTRAVSRGVGVFTVSGSKISSFAMYMFRQNITR